MVSTKSWVVSICHENLFKFFIIYILTSLELRCALFRKYNITNWIIHMRGVPCFQIPFSLPQNPAKNVNHCINSNLIMILNWQSSSKCYQLSSCLWTRKGSSSSYKVSIPRHRYETESSTGETIAQGANAVIINNTMKSFSHERTHQQLSLYRLGAPWKMENWWTMRGAHGWCQI